MLKSMLTSKSVASNIISINLEAGLNWISFALNKSWFAVVSSPKPNIIDDNISTVYLNHDRSRNFRWIWTTNSCKDIMDYSWIFSRSFICSISPFQKRFSILWSSLKKKPRNFNSIDIWNFNAWLSIWRNQCS